MKKKMIAMLLVCLLIMSSLAGCGGGDSKTSNKSKDGVVDLVLWANYGSATIDVLRQYAEAFNESQNKYNITVETGDARATLTTLKQEDYPSVFTSQPLYLYELSKSDYTAPIQQFIDADEDKWTEDIYTTVQESYTDKDGNMIGVPMGLSTKGYMVNVDMLKEAGYTLEDVTSFEKIAEISQAAYDKKLCTYGYTWATGYDLLNVLSYQGLDVVDAGNGWEGTVTKSLYDQGETNVALTKLVHLIADMVESGAAFKHTDNAYSGQSMFLSEECLFWTCTNSYYYVMADADFEWAFIPHVGLDDSAKYKDCAMIEGTGLFIANTGDEEEMQGAYEFIKFMSSVENQVSWCSYRGYIPFTNAAAQNEDWITWRDENFASAAAIEEKIKNTPDGLVSPYTSIGSAIVDANLGIFSNLVLDASDKKIDEYIQQATEEINLSIEMLTLRGE